MNQRTERKDERLREKYTKLIHSSGLTVYLYPKELSTAYCLIATKFGSIHNCFTVGSDEESVRVPDGVAHFLEHKMFENEDGEDTFAKFARTGASANAYTTFNTTAYLFSCTEELPASLKILLTSVFSPYFTEDNVKKEQAIIAQEIRMCEDDPDDVLLYGMLGCLYRHNNVRLNIAGTVESIAGITPDILYRCHSTFYNPFNMALCVCGKYDEAEIMSVIDSAMQHLMPQSVTVHDEEEPDEIESPRFSVKMAVSKPLFCIGVKDTAISDDPGERMKKRAALQILSALYFDKSGDFYLNLYNDGLIAPNLSVWSPHCRDFSFFSMNGESSQPEEVFRRFTAYTDTICQSPIDETDFERCRRAQYAAFIREFDSTEEIANNIITNFDLDGGEIFDYADILFSMTPGDIAAVRDQLFSKERYVLSTVLPLD